MVLVARSVGQAEQVDGTEAAASQDKEGREKGQVASAAGTAAVEVLVVGGLAEVVRVAVRPEGGAMVEEELVEVARAEVAQVAEVRAVVG